MEARETDKLFRDKLKNAASAPQEDSWSKLASMLDEDEKATPWITSGRVAAAVLLLMVSASVVFFWNTEGPEKTEVSMVEQPSELQHESRRVVPEVKVEEVVENEEIIETKENKKIEPVPVKTIIKEPVKKEVIESTETISQPEPPAIEDQQMAQLEETPEIIAVEPPVKKKFKSIKITYKRGNAPLPKQEEMIAEQQVDSTGGNKIKELWTQTKDINAGDLWADIREAKDNLFQRNSKKNNVKNLNK